MHKNIGFVVFTVMAFLSCSSDDDGANGSQAAKAIVGTWDVTELRIDNATASDNAKFGKQVLDYLVDRECTVVTFQFNEDLTAKATDATGYIEAEITPQGLSIPCPTSFDTENGTYTFDGATLTLIDDEGIETVVSVAITGDQMFLDAADLDVADFNESGQLVFTKR